MDCAISISPSKETYMKYKKMVPHVFTKMDIDWYSNPFFLLVFDQYY